MMIIMTTSRSLSYALQLQREKNKGFPAVETRIDPSIKTCFVFLAVIFLEDHQPHISKLMINNCNISQKEFANRKICTKINEQSKLTDQCDTHSFVSDQVKNTK